MKAPYSGVFTIRETGSPGWYHRGRVGLGRVEEPVGRGMSSGLRSLNSSPPGDIGTSIPISSCGKTMLSYGD